MLHKIDEELQIIDIPCEVEIKRSTQPKDIKEYLKQKLRIKIIKHQMIIKS